MESEFNTIFEKLYDHEQEILLNKAKFLLDNGYITGNIFTIAKIMAKKLHEREIENVNS